MLDLRKLNIEKFKKLAFSGKINLTEFYKDFVSFTKKKDKELLAFESFNEKVILERVKHLQDKIKATKSPARLYAAPLAVKDVINTVELPTKRGSKYWDGYVAGNNARVADLIEYEGGIVTGKTVTAELAVHHPGETRNPHNTDYSPGTSSMGSAVCVCAGMSIAALGTQTGSSIIRPASYTGVFGYKPSYGIIPRTGVLKTTDTLDHVGFFANHIEDIQLLFDVLRVRGDNYPVSNSMLAKRSGFKRTIKIGLLRPQYLWKNYQSYVRRAFDKLGDSLARSKNLQVIGIKDEGWFDNSHYIHSILYDKSLAYYFRRESRDINIISSTLRVMVEHGNEITVNEFHKALAEQEQMQAGFDAKFSKYDIIFTPSTANIAPKRDNYREVDDTGLIWSLLGVPSLNIPVFRGPGDMPFGLQATGVKYSDYRLLSIVKDLIDKGILSPITKRVKV